VPDTVPRPDFPQIAGHAALDLVDTVHWRLDPARLIDTLGSFDDVLAWCEQLGLLSGVDHLRELARSSPERAADEHARIVRLRETVCAMALDGSAADDSLVRDEHVAALGRSSLEHDAAAGRWVWRAPDDLTAPRAVVAMLAHDLLTDDLSDVRQCADEACGWVYLDRSPRHNRRWCTAAGCGNRNRVARHQARKKQQG
jgi:predicted RNA-binding Zn ribbon-like protein